MALDKRRQEKSGSAERSSKSDIESNVDNDDGEYQGSCDAAQVKQELSELENIIMEGDIILKVHSDKETEDSAQKGFQILSGECAKHGDLFLYQDDTLVKVGDKFKSNKDFVKYVNENAKRWCFYYKCTESQNVDTDTEAYTYSCVYLRNREYKRKWVKKRLWQRTDCPCKVKLRRRPGEDLTVIEVCYHHDHNLSKENFNKLQHHKKLPPFVKELIMDLLALEVEIVKIRKCVEVETGAKMSRAFFYEFERKMKLKNEERQISDKRLKELSDKMTVIDELYSCDDEDNTDDQDTPFKRKRTQLSSKTGLIVKYDDDENTMNLEESMKSESQISWITDQSDQAPRRTLEWEDTSRSDIKGEAMDTTYQDQESQNSQDYTETADNTIADNEYTDEYIIGDSTANVETTNADTTNADSTFSQYETVVLQDELGNEIICENDEQIVILQPDENGLVHGENGAIGYFDGEQIIYMDPNQQSEQNDGTAEQEGVEESNACDAAVQTNSANPGRSFVPVFDVYMKNGNVTGFVVNDNVVKGSAEKDVHGSHELSQNSSQLTDTVMEPLVDMSSSNATQEYVSGDTYTKDEYIHRYNIDHYMANPHFPKYIDTLAKKTRTDVMQMLARVYAEKAMFKMTTTRKGKEGDTKMWYLTDVRRKGRYKMSDEEKMKRDKLGQYITDILILKERVKSIKKENEELVARNKYLEEVALRLAKQLRTTESN